MTGQPFRVMVVDDSAVIRGFIARWLEEDPEISVVTTASNGQIAVKTLVSSDAEVVVLDIEMPVMDGLTALPALIQQVPDIKVVMASTLSTRNADISMRALTLGAADYVPKPESAREVNASSTFKKELVDKVKALAAARRRTRNEELPSDRRYGAALKSAPARPSPSSPAGAPGTAAAEPTTAPIGRFAEAAAAGGQIQLVSPSKTKPTVLAIGASTGGPQALAKFLGAVSAFIKIPVVVTQHMPPTFTAILAEHLGKETGLPAKEAENGEVLKSGHIYVAPGGHHMTIEGGAGGPRLMLNEGPQEHFCRPSVNPMFRSVASIFGDSALCVMLTGMGADGIEASHDVVKAGGTLIAQDEASSVVWGMPGAVAMAGICSSVLPLDILANEAIKLMSGGNG